MEQLVNSHAIPDDLKELILNLPGILAPWSLLMSLKKEYKRKSIKCAEVSERCFEILDDWGFSDHVAMNLGMVQSMNYYTKLFSELYIRIGFPVLSGGRYDNLIKGLALIVRPQVFLRD